MMKADPSKNMSSYLKNNSVKKCCIYGSSDSVPALQVWDLEFKPLYHEKGEKCQLLSKLFVGILSEILFC
jgi:hypothetical protein